MEEYLADLHGCINCLGSLDNNQFIKDVDTIVSLRDILRHLRRETEKCEIRIELGKFKVVEKCFLSLLKSYHDDSVLFDLLIRLLMNLTQPSFICFKQTIPEDSDAMEIYLEVDSILQKYKPFFADKSFLEILSTKITEIYNKEWEDRSEDDHLMVERILILMRNMLHINTSKSDNTITHGIRSKHDELIMAMIDGGWKEILIYLSNTEEEHRFAFHTLEIISLMFREQSIEFMIKSKGKHSLESISERQLVKQQAMEVKEKSTDNPRAYRYGGTFELRNIKTFSGRPAIYHHDVSSGKIDLNQDRKMRAKAKNRLPNKEEIYCHKSTDDVLIVLQEFCELFLQFGYNILMKNALSSFQRQQMQPDDETYYLWALKFFMAVCRLNKYNPEYVSETLNTEVFLWVYQQAITYFENGRDDKSTAKASFRKLHLAMSSFKELLEFCLMLDNHKEDKYRKLSASIKSRAFYNDEYIEIFPILIIKFNVIKQSRACLRELIEGSFLIMKLLQDHQTFGMNFVRKLKKKRSRQKSNKKLEEAIPIVELPEDNIDVLQPIWGEIFESVKTAVKGEIDLPTDLPIIYDALLPETREPIEPGSDPVDSQLKRALGIIQIRLRQKKSVEAVALFRLCQTLWPDEDRIITGEDEDSVEDALKILKDIMFAAKFYRDEDLVEKPPIIEEQNSDSSESENEDEINMKAHEVAFDFEKFILKFCHPNIVSAFGIVFSDYLTNPPSTNNRLLKIMHNIAEKFKKPFVLYQLKLFNGFNKFLQDPVSNLIEFQEMRKFIIFLLRKFFEHVSKNRKLLLEILFSKSYNEAYLTANGYIDADDCSNQKLWSDELESELVRLFEEVQYEEIAPGCDKISVIQHRFSDKTKTRRQIINRMVTLGLIKSAKELKNKKRSTIPWTGDEQARLIVLVEESRDQPNPIREIMNGLKATTEDPENLRSRQVVVKKILELGLVDSKEKLGIRSKGNKLHKPNDSDSDEDENENENNDYDNNDDEESKFMNEIFQKSLSSSMKRNPPPPKVKRTIDWSALKMTYARLDDKERQWFVDLLVDNIDSRANGIVGHLTIVPIEEHESVILENKLVQNLLYICNFLYPDPSEGYSFWRIPENMTAKELEYFRNCVTNLSEDEMQALTSTDLDSVVQPFSVTNELNKEESRNISRGSVKTKKSKKILNSDSEERETYFDSTNEERENTFSSKKKKSSRLLLSENDEESENISGNEQLEISSTIKKKSLKLIESDDDDEEENKILSSGDDEKENVSIPRQRKSEIFESENEEDEENIDRKYKMKKRVIIDSDDEIESPQVKRVRISDEDN